MDQLFNLANYSLSTFSTFLFVSGLFVFILGIRTMFIRKSTLTISFIILSLVLTTWLWGASLMYLSTNPDVSLFWFTRVAHLGILLIPFSQYLFLSQMFNPDGKKTNYLTAVIIFVIAICLYIANTLPSTFITRMELKNYGYTPIVGRSYYVVLVYFVLALGYVVVNHIINWKKSYSPTQIKQLRPVLIAFFVGNLGAMDFLPLLNVDILPIGFLFEISFALVIAYTIVKYQFLLNSATTTSSHVLQTMSDFLVVVDDEFNITLTNSAMNKIIKSPSQLLGKPLNSLFANQKNILNDLTKKLKSTPQINDVSMQLSTPAQPSIPVSVNISAVTHRQKPISYVIIMRNVSGTQKLINQLKNQTHTLDEQNRQLEKFNKLVVNRELKMIELKRKLKNNTKEKQVMKSSDPINPQKRKLPEIKTT